MPSTAFKAADIESSILLRAAERARQLVINAHEAKAANLTHGEIAAILVNSANVDRLNLSSLTAKPTEERSDPVGATDLTNEINEPSGRVLLHPVLSLYGDLAYTLEQRAAPSELCREARDLAHLLEEKHRAQLKQAGLKEEWPEFRRNWETSLADRGYIDWKTYGPSRPRPGCSSEYVLDFVARQNGLIPDFNTLDRLMLRGELIARGLNGPALDVEVERHYFDRRTQVDQKMAAWSQFVGVASETYGEHVVNPIIARSKAWFYTCKDLSPKETARIGDFCQKVESFANTQPLLDATVIAQAADTAAVTVIGPTMEEEIIKRGIGFGGRIAEKAMKSGASKGMDYLGDKGAEIFDKALTAGVASTGFPGLLYFVGKSAAKIFFPKVTEKAEDLVEGGIGKIVGWAKTTTQNLVYEESRAKETELAAKLALSNHSTTSVPVERLVRELTPAGFRAATLISEAFEIAQDDKRATKLIDFAVSKPDADAALELASLVNPEVLPKHYSDPVGLGMDFKGHKLERVQASRMAAAGLIESSLGVAIALGGSPYTKGESRLRHSLQNARQELTDITRVDAVEAKPDSTEQADEFEQGMDLECFRLLAEATRAHVRPLGDTCFFSGRSVSRLLGCCEYAHEHQTGVPARNRSDTYDYSVLMQINAALWSRQISPEVLRDAISKVEPFELKPQTVSSPTSVDEELAIAEKAVGRLKGKESPAV